MDKIALPGVKRSRPEDNPIEPVGSAAGITPPKMPKSPGSPSKAPAAKKKKTSKPSSSSSAIITRAQFSHSVIEEFTIAKGPNTVLAEYDDAPTLAGIEVDAEKQIAQTKASAVMTAAEREREGWAATHVIHPAAVKRALDAAREECVPMLKFATVAERNSAEEYLARGFQELLCLLLPELVVVTRHAYGTGPAPADALDIRLQQRQVQPNPATIGTKDLLTFCSASRLISGKVDGFIKESLEQQLGE